MVVEKKTRLEQQKRGQFLYKPYRAIGYVVGDVPICVHAGYITTALENTYQIFDLESMNLKFTGPITETPITALAVQRDRVYLGTACGDVLICTRNRVLATYKATSRCLYLLAIGDLLFGVYENETLKIWDLKSRELYRSLEFKGKKITCIAHPDTYLNKIVVGGFAGELELWNIKNGKLIYEFSHAQGSPVISLAPAPVVDVLGVGLSDGRVLLVNLKADVVLMELRQQGPVMALAFRTDEIPLLASSNRRGDVTFWDLNQAKLAHVLVKAHEGATHSLNFLPNQPLLLTAGCDNSVKQWLFDDVQYIPRLLKFRTGHSEPPQIVRFYGRDDSKWVISAGRDNSVRLMSIIRDSQSVELSQGSVAKVAKKTRRQEKFLKLPQVISLDACPTREKDWDNLLTAHQNSSEARTWSTLKKALGEHHLCSRDESKITSVAVSNCGNYGILGLNSGKIDMFNLQSGIYKGTFSKGGHERKVTGVASDASNKRLISCSIDSTLKIWCFKTMTVLHNLAFSSPLSRLCLYMDNDLAAVSCDDFALRVIDIETVKVVREFSGHSHFITDFRFSPDGQWLVSASMDGTIRTWDLPTGTMINWLGLDSICTSLDFSPDSSLLATAHKDYNGIYLWSNRSFYEDVSLSAVTEKEAPKYHLPTVSLDQGEDAVELLEEELGQLQLIPNPAPLDLDTSAVITLSSQPEVKWNTLLNLEHIKKRNKPKEPPKAPEQAPFFLPTLPGVELTFIPAEQKEESKSGSRIKAMDISDLRTKLSISLDQAAENDFVETIKQLEQSSVSQLDLEIQSLEPGEWSKFLSAMAWCFESRTRFDLAQACLRVFLKYHVDELLSQGGEDVREKLERVKQVQESEWKRLERLYCQTLCLLDFASFN